MNCEFQWGEQCAQQAQPCVCCCTRALVQLMLITGEPSQSSAASGALLISRRTLLEIELRIDTGQETAEVLGFLLPGD